MGKNELPLLHMPQFQPELLFCFKDREVHLDGYIIGYRIRIKNQNYDAQYTQHMVFKNGVCGLLQNTPLQHARTVLGRRVIVEIVPQKQKV